MEGEVDTNGRVEESDFSQVSEQVLGERSWRDMADDDERMRSLESRDILLTLLRVCTGSDSVQSPLDTSGQRVAVHDFGNSAKVQTKQETDSIDGAGVGRRV